MKNIVLIGGSKGIGFEVAKMLQKDNHVIVASRTKGKLDDLNITHLKFDATKDSVNNLDLPNAIDGLVFFPGTINLKPFQLLKPKDFEEDLQLNFLAMVRVIHELLPKLKNAEKPSLVFYSTVAVKMGMPFHTSVAAAKGAIEGFAKSLAAEYAPNFRVNVVAPSLTDTPLAKNLLNKEEKKRKLAERHPLKRIGNPKDIAQITSFLLSEKSDWITGQVFGVDGGLSSLNLQ